MHPYLANVRGVSGVPRPPPVEHICLHGLRLARGISYLRDMTQLKIALVTVLGFALAAASQAQAQIPSASTSGVNAAARMQGGGPGGSSAASLEGRTVRGQGGVVLGHVERVILRADGSPVQVLVRPKGPRAGGPRSLAYSSLRVDGDGLSIPLNQAEFNAMPAIDVTGK